MHQWVKKIKAFVLRHAVLQTIVLSVWNIPKQIKLFQCTKRRLKCVASERNKIFYIGIPVHTNLGDLAQGVCIRRWIKKHYPDRTIVEIETNALVNTKFSALGYLKKAYKNGDFIVFQSGYTTTDLGGYADLMHRAVMRACSEAKILMLPQTIFFQNEKNKKETAQIYNSTQDNMLFLARDTVSYEMAKEMFPDVPTKAYPDIVTTLIGQYTFHNDRDGILFCCRNDGEKYYSDEDIAVLIEKCSQIGKTDKIDTTKNGQTEEIVRRAEDYILQEIEKYSQYKVMITDRYHGTILSLIAGTPVIIIKTNDHKVITGAEWFKGVYDDYVYVAETLDEAYELARKIYYQTKEYRLEPYFEKEYYDCLPKLFAQSVRK